MSPPKPKVEDALATIAENALDGITRTVRSLTHLDDSLGALLEDSDDEEDDEEDE